MDKNWISVDEQVDRINKLAHKNDTLIILGDVGEIKNISRLKAGYKVLIMGNHDTGRSNFERKIITKRFSKDMYTRENALNKMKEDYPDCEYYKKGEVVVHKRDNLHEANLLMLNIEKANKVLGWIPTYTADKAISETVDWYKHFYVNDTNMYEFTLEQIKKYEENIKWKNN